MITNKNKEISSCFFVSFVDESSFFTKTEWPWFRPIEAQYQLRLITLARKGKEYYLCSASTDIETIYKKRRCSLEH